MKEQIKIIIDAFFDDWECPSNKVYSEHLAERLDKAIGIDEDKVYQIILQQDIFNPDMTILAEIIDSAQATAKAKPIKC